MAKTKMLLLDELFFFLALVSGSAWIWRRSVWNDWFELTIIFFVDFFFELEAWIFNKIRTSCYVLACFSFVIISSMLFPIASELIDGL